MLFVITSYQVHNSHGETCPDLREKFQTSFLILEGLIKKQSEKSSHAGFFY